MIVRGSAVGAAVLLLFWSGERAHSGAQEPGDRAVTSALTAVAATVNDEPILVAEVNHLVRKSLGTREVTREAEALLQAEALEQLIAQQKVLIQLQHRGEACTQQELDRELKRLEADWKRQEKTLDDYCRALGLSRESLHRLLRWQLSWRRCSEKYATQENLRLYFTRHQREFDGTQLRVAQILLRADEGADRPALLRRAEQIRREIDSGQLTFADAARRYSQAPTAAAGGELGWISRREPMPEYFAQAAFKLQVGELSTPVASPFGVHLITCLEVQPGAGQWPEMREQVREAALAYLFRWLAEQSEPQVAVRYTGQCPHFQPGTRELASSH